MKTDNLTWLLGFYETVFDWDFYHHRIPHWYSCLPGWTVSVVDVSRKQYQQLPLFIMD